MDSETYTIDLKRNKSLMCSGRIIHKLKNINNIKLIINDLQEEQIRNFLLSDVFIRMTYENSVFDNNIAIRLINVLFINKIFFNKECNDVSQIDFYLMTMLGSFYINDFRIYGFTNNMQLQIELTSEPHNKNIKFCVCESYRLTLFVFCAIDVSNFDEINDIYIKSEKKLIKNFRFRIINIKNFKFLFFSLYDIDLYNPNIINRRNKK
jgi:hypothetical protein